MYYRQKYNPFNSCLLGYDDRQSGQWLPLFQSNIRLRYHLTKLKVEAVGFRKSKEIFTILRVVTFQKLAAIILSFFLVKQLTCIHAWIEKEYGYV